MKKLRVHASHSSTADHGRQANLFEIRTCCIVCGSPDTRPDGNVGGRPVNTCQGCGVGFHPEGSGR